MVMLGALFLAEEGEPGSHGGQQAVGTLFLQAGACNHGDHMHTGLRQKE